MRFTSLLGLVCLTATTLAAPVEQASQDLITLQKIFSKVQGNLNGLTNAIRDLDNLGRRGQDTDKQEMDIERRANGVTQAIRDGTGTIRRSPMLTSPEATALVGPIEELGAVTQRTVDAWILAKPSIVRAGGRKPVLKLLADQERATDDFVDAIQAKMPLLTLTAARIYGQKARTQVDLAIAAFNLP